MREYQNMFLSINLEKTRGTTNFLYCFLDFANRSRNIALFNITQEGSNLTPFTVGLLHTQFNGFSHKTTLLNEDVYLEH